jgi:hypothetical protein
MFIGGLPDGVLPPRVQILNCAIRAQIQSSRLNVRFWNERKRTMAKVTLVFAVLLVALGLAGFLGTGSQHPTALIPAWIGLLLGLFGWMAIRSNEDRRRLFMHINGTIGLVGFVGTVAEIVRNLASSKELDMTALEAKMALAWLLLIYIALCARSCRTARRLGKV